MKIFNLKLVKIRLCYWLLLNSQIFESSELFAIIIVKHIFINYYMNQETNFILQICSSFGIIILLNCFFFFLTTSSMYVVYSGHPHPSILSPPHTTSSPFLPPSISTTLSISVLFLLFLCDPMNFIRAPLTGMSAKLFSGTFVHHWWLHHCRQGLLSSRNPLLSLVPLAVWGPIGSSAIYDWKLIGPLLCKPYANDQNNSEIKSVMTISWP